MSEDNKLTEGMYFNEPSERAPDFIKGSISIEPKQFTEWLRKVYNKDEKYVRIDLKISKAGKAYSILSDFKPNQGQQSGNNTPQTSHGSSQDNNQGNGFNDDVPW